MAIDRDNLRDFIMYELLEEEEEQERRRKEAEQNQKPCKNVANEDEEI